MRIGKLLKIAAKGVGVLCVSGAAIVAYDFSRVSGSENQSLRDAFRHYVLFAGLRQVGKSVWKAIDADCQNVYLVQEETLIKRLRECDHTEYGKDHNFTWINSRENFIKLHPLTRYDHYRDYVARVAEGHKNVLTVEDPAILALTSGTSGASSMMPMLTNQTKVFFQYGVAPCFHLMTEAYPQTYNVQKDMKLFYTPRPRDKQAGIPVGPNSSNPQNSERVWDLYSTPPICYNVTSEPEATYLYLLFALKDRKLGLIEANFASLVYSAILNLEKNWERLVHDIEFGELDSELDVPDHVRTKVNELLQPDKKRGNELREEFSKGFQGIMRRVWPDLHLLLTVDSGSFDLYGRQLRDGFAQGIPTYSPLYGATEGLVGLNIEPLAEQRRYLLLPRAMFFEFIPIDQCEEDQPQTLFMDQVKEGETYELVITNMSCYFRYRFGDVVKVTGFHHQCPKVEFLYRQGQFLNIRGEKTSEQCLYGALLSASEQWERSKLRDYCCTPSVTLEQADGTEHSLVNHYVLFLELEGEADLSEDDVLKIDSCLRARSFAYDSLRHKGSLGPVQVCVVEKGTFSDLKQRQVSQDRAASNQYKVPRVLNDVDTVKYLMGKLKG